SAILVSHDVNLALKYADQIIVLTKNSEKGFGEILPQNIFNRFQWESLYDGPFQDFRNNLLHLFASGSKVEQKTTVIPSQISSVGTVTYETLFKKKEGKALLGKKSLNLVILTSILFLTLLTVGFANGALEYLRAKLKNPFVNWITIALPAQKSTPEFVKEFKENLTSVSVSNHYFIDYVTAYKVAGFQFVNIGTGTSEYLNGRLVSYEDPIAKDFVSKGNIIDGSFFKDEFD